jgi:hypothetical protein
MITKRKERSRTRERNMLRKTKDEKDKKKQDNMKRGELERSKMIESTMRKEQDWN